MRNRRLFFAIKPPERVCDALETFIDTHKELPVRWTERSNLHLTLLFLGWVPETGVNELMKKGRELLSEPQGSILFSHLDWGPPSGSTRMIWTHGTADPSWGTLKERMRTALASEDLYHGADEWPFTPHITVARMEPTTKSKLPNIRTGLLAEFTPSGVLLMESTLSQKGPTYSTIETFPLPKKT